MLNYFYSCFFFFPLGHRCLKTTSNTVSFINAEMHNIISSCLMDITYAVRLWEALQNTYEMKKPDWGNNRIRTIPKSESKYSYQMTESAVKSCQWTQHNKQFESNHPLRHTATWLLLFLQAMKWQHNAKCFCCGLSEDGRGKWYSQDQYYWVFECHVIWLYHATACRKDNNILNV